MFGLRVNLIHFACPRYSNFLMFSYIKKYRKPVYGRSQQKSIVSTDKFIAFVAGIVASNIHIIVMLSFLIFFCRCADNKYIAHICWTPTHGGARAVKQLSGLHNVNKASKFQTFVDRHCLVV